MTSSVGKKLIFASLLGSLSYKPGGLLKPPACIGCELKLLPLEPRSLLLVAQVIAVTGQTHTYKVFKHPATVTSHWKKKGSSLILH